MPHLVYNTEQTIAAAKRLWIVPDSPDVMIKVPGTLEGLLAIEQLIAAGVNVNVTLLIGLERYYEIANAFMVADNLRRKSFGTSCKSKSVPNRLIE